MRRQLGLAALAPEARERLEARATAVREDPTRIRTAFPAAAREVGRSPGSATDPGEPRLEDAVRGRLLEALLKAGADPGDRAEEVRDLYRYGDADERRAVLLALHCLDIGDRLVDLVHDALRTNDPRLVAAALGRYGADVLDDDAWRQGVLKCLFTGVPTELVDGFERRADDRLVAMVAAYAEERTAAGRTVPADAERILAGAAPLTTAHSPREG